MTAVQYARCAPDWAASTAPLPILRPGVGRHRAPGGRTARRRRAAALRVRQQLAAAALLTAVAFGAPGGEQA